MFSSAFNLSIFFLAFSFLQSCSADPTEADGDAMKELSPNDFELKGLLTTACPEIQKRLSLNELPTIGYIGEATTYRRMNYEVPHFQVIADGKTRDCDIEFQAISGELPEIHSLTCN